jgi:hypothetical protein
MGLLGITGMTGLKSYIATAVWTTRDDAQSSKFMKFHGLRSNIKGLKRGLKLAVLTGRAQCEESM